MTQEEKRIKLAEAFGMTGWKEARCLPDYFGDLNAAHELEELLTESQQSIFADRLNMLHEIADLTYLNSNARGYRKALFSEAFHLIHATAAQRAEALGLTLNLWTP